MCIKRRILRAALKDSQEQGEGLWTLSTEITYSVEQEQFRKEVSAWLNEHAQIPSDLSIPRETGDMSPELYTWVREYRKKLGGKGWQHLPWGCGVQEIRNDGF